jgi:D-tyrosyl-tRNA(Tyr) deacylase
MIALLQRVSQATVTIDRQTIAAIGAGVLALVAAEPDDDEARAVRLAARVRNYRLFADDQDRMNLSAGATGKAILAVPQFTLAADTSRGNRPGFATAAPPAQAEALFARFVAALRARHDAIETGRFGANMQVALVNDGPVTFWLRA